MTDMKTAVLSSLRDAKMPCAFAFRVADGHGWEPIRVGAEADRLAVRISRCQLGLFGYDSFRQKGIVQRLSAVPGDVVVSLRAAETDGRVSCASLWRIADDHGLPKVAIACAAETLGLRVTECQLGCF